MTVRAVVRQVFQRAATLSLALGFLLTPAIAGGPEPGVSNFREVNAHLYRGAQPAAQGYERLAKLGVKTVIDLRGGEEHAVEEKKAVTAAGMRYVNIPMSGVHAPTDEQMARALQILNDSSAWPVFVHCRRGKDRTGAVVACYRIAQDRWSNRKALAEAKSLGMSWFQRGKRRYILHYGTAVRQVSAPALQPAAASH